MITRAQIRRQLRAQGGIMNTVPREGFFLGGVGDFFGDVLGKAGKAVKKVVGSPIGRAALLGIGAFGLPGGAFGMKGFLPQGMRSLSGLGSKLFGSQGADKLMGATGLFEKLGLTKGAGSMGLTGKGMLTAGGLLSYFMAKGATEEEAEDLIKDVYRGEGIGFDQIRADINKYRSGELNQQQMFDKNYRFLVPRGSFRAAEGGRVGLRSGGMNKRRDSFIAAFDDAIDRYMSINDVDVIPIDIQEGIFNSLRKKMLGRAEGGRAGYQTGGISMGNTLAQNIAANQAQAGQVQQMLQAARSRLPGAAPAGITSVPTSQTQTMAEPQPMAAPQAEPQPMAAPQAEPQPMAAPSNIQYLSGAMASPEVMGAPPRIQGMGGMNPEDFMKLSEAEIQKRMNANVAREDAELRKYESFADGRMVDPRTVGRSAYNDLLNVFRYDFPQVQLTGNETLAELDTMAGKLYGYKNGGRIGFKSGSKNKTIIPKKKPKFMTEEELEELYPGLARGEIYDYEKKKKAAKKANGGLMEIPTGDMRRNRAGVMERDYRDEGGFVPVGVKEKADDVPAMLSKNEFVMTADAVRGAGDGNINKGAQRMYDLMKQNESKVV